ncbi:hypothetical protein BDN71DRAFT_1509448 [Pleurotus eryngii]|uniref:Helitron helicase-like domain-containing protein n=1 Tax=Pleurotus eryngii TaxID=5323 RepID=A0A9P5ZRZ8_PLEER|nr:hypothetical protein BDN71DRAFT_1509448 [Pleurotus eryngii]
MTINPSDIHDPITQFLVGEDINLDNFNTYLGPDNATRAFNIAENPLSATEFFHLTIRVFLKEVLGISAVDLRGSNKIKRQTGILGDIEAFIGTVEAQGCSMLHLHLLLWLEDAPMSQEMSEALQGEAFCKRARQWIKNNITGDIRGLSVPKIEAILKKNNYSYSWPLRPDNPNYITLHKEELQKLARSLLVCVCKGHGCLSKNSTKSKCKRQAPFDRAEEAWIDEDGRWGPKHLHPYIVGHNQTCLLLLRCNHNIKLLTNAYDSSGIFWYITIALELEELNYLDFFVDTYEYSASKNTKPTGKVKVDKGFPPLPGSRSSKTRHVRQQGHETLPAFIGQWFPRRSDNNTKEFYLVSMLALFKPWRDLGDLKTKDETFEHTFDVFMLNAPKEYKHIMDNMEYYYLSAEAANVTDEDARKGPDPE